MFLLIVMISISYNVSALGVTPARKIVNFEPGLEQTVQFSVVNNEKKEMEVAIFVEGEFADYVELSDNYLVFNSNDNSKSVQYTFKLPQHLDPGTHETKITVRELTNPDNTGETFVSASVAVVHQLHVKVPYPGKYATIDLKLAQTGRLDSVTFIMPVHNLGTENIKSVKGNIEIYDSAKTKITTLTTNEKPIESKETGELTATWSGDLTPGKYYAKAFAQYDKNITKEIEKLFFVGAVGLEILEISVNEDFRLGDIAKFNILLENTWTEQIEEVYIEMILNKLDGTELVRFKTPTDSVGPLQRQEFIAYWDTIGMEPGEYESTLILYYDGEVKEEKLKTVLSVNSIEFFLNGPTGRVAYGGSRVRKEVTLTFLVLILLGANAVWFIYFKRKKKRTNKQKTQHLNIKKQV